MDLLENFAADIGSKKPSVLKDVQEYIHWETDRGQIAFDPQTSDDVAIRTYLLDCRIRGINRLSLNRIASSIEQFYAWLEQSGSILQSPFKKYNLRLPFLDLRSLLPRHDAFAGPAEERELSRLRALNRLAASTNQVPDVRSLFDVTLDALLGEMTLHTAWISLTAENGLLPPSIKPIPKHRFILAAARNLPPALEKDNRYFLTRPPECHCQLLLRTGRLVRGVNIVECSRLQDAMEGKHYPGGLMFHASVPISISEKTIGVMNFAAKDWQLLSASDLHLLSSGARQLSAALQRARLYDSMRVEHNRLETEIDSARRMQVSLLPEKLPRIKGFSLAAFWQPARETSGDYYNVFKLDEGRWGLIVADVCGKGAPAALRMALTHGFIRDRVETEASPAALLSTVNRRLCEKNSEMEFVTSFYAILDPQNGILKYALAGHPPPFIRKADGRVRKLSGRGMALGVDPDADYKETRLTLAPGDCLLAFTDGLTDATSPGDQSYELTRLKSAIQTGHAPAAALLEHLKNALSDWVREAPSYDDITLLALTRQPQ